MTVEKSSCSQRKSDAADSREEKIAESRGDRFVGRRVIEDKDCSGSIEQGLRVAGSRREKVADRNTGNAAVN
jgi:hypothetical protein